MTLAEQQAQEFNTSMQSYSEAVSLLPTPRTHLGIAAACCTAQQLGQPSHCSYALRETGSQVS